MACDEKRPSLTEDELAATCPFMRTLLANNPDLYDAKTRTMSREELKGFVEKQRSAGEDGSLERVLDFFAKVNHTPHELRQTGDRFSTHFPGSRGDHPGSSGIYREADGRFNVEAFERVIAKSSDKTTMTPADIARAIIDSNSRDSDSSSLDLFKSAGEFALLFMLLRQPGSARLRDMRMSIEDMRMLFECNEWPQGALANLATATAREWLEMTAFISKEIVSQNGVASLQDDLLGFLSEVRKAL